MFYRLLGVPSAFTSQHCHCTYIQYLLDYHTVGITYLCSWQTAVSKFIQRCNFAVSDSTSQIVHVCLKAIWAQLNSAAFPCKVSHCLRATVWLAFGKITASVSLKIKIFFILLFKKLFVFLERSSPDIATKLRHIGFSFFSKPRIASEIQ